MIAYCACTQNNNTGMFKTKEKKQQEQKTKLSVENFRMTKLMMKCLEESFLNKHF